MKKIFRLPFFAAVAAVGLAYGAMRLLFPSQYVSEEFLAAHKKSAEVAEIIVRLSGENLVALEQIAQHDRNGNFSEALLLISQRLIANREMQMEAIRLSSQLERMARLTNEIRPSRAREVATEGISAEVALVSRLVGYNDYLHQLFEVLRQRFEKPYEAWKEKDHVQVLIGKINEEAQAINNFNQRFVASMQTLESILLK